MFSGSREIDRETEADSDRQVEVRRGNDTDRETKIQTRQVQTSRQTQTDAETERQTQ